MQIQFLIALSLTTLAFLSCNKSTGSINSNTDAEISSSLSSDTKLSSANASSSGNKLSSVNASSSETKLSSANSSSSGNKLSSVNASSSANKLSSAGSSTSISSSTRSYVKGDSLFFYEPYTWLPFDSSTVYVFAQVVYPNAYSGSGILHCVATDDVFKGYYEVTVKQETRIARASSFSGTSTSEDHYPSDSSFGTFQIWEGSGKCELRENNP